MRLLSLCMFFFICLRTTRAGISEEKCKEYEELSFKPKVCTSLLPIYLPNLGDAGCHSDLGCDSTTPLIVGGEEAKNHEFPHFALLGYNFGNPIFEHWRFLCGGSLISENFILTAAHCKSSEGIEVGLVRLGESDLSPNRAENNHVTDYIILKFINHPSYDPYTLLNDIALIKLVVSAELSLFVRPACLHQNNTEVLKGRTALAIGFGATSYGDDLSEKLLKVNLTVVHPAKCDKISNTNKTAKTQLCVKGEKTASGQFKDTCSGDSGGPIQFISHDNHCMFNLFGIVSNGKLCGYDLPALYTRISAYIPWIEDIVWK